MKIDLKDRKILEKIKNNLQQTKFMKFGIEQPKTVLKCPYCSGELEFVMYMKKGPPEILREQRELLDYIRVESKI